MKTREVSGESGFAGFRQRLALSARLLGCLWLRGRGEEPLNRRLEAVFAEFGLGLAGVSPHEVEPTTEMIDAGWGILSLYDQQLDDGYETVKEIWRAIHQRS